MTVIPFRRRPAFGSCPPAGRRHRLAVLAALVLLPGAALGVRASGVLGSASDRTLPSSLAVATVAPGLLRGGGPADVDLLRLRDDHGVRAVVAVGGMAVEEQAATRALGQRSLQLAVADGAAPSADELVRLVRFLRSATGTGVVYLHDRDGHGPVLVTAALLRVLRGVPATTALDELRAASERPVTAAEARAVSTVRSWPQLRGESW
ncbi:hypothetical protein [Actinoplanes sp. N902-109]|uniref:hypothetical protein n=1 Tax=Actinoplanes sp. (strain N902-109) TaxID=649831 RepID=UPI00032950BC|nr:hypothetical protein [Actinoplanes sp. N902-109]AGL17161.1 hypothetical protein L083_3651 [Actinoplanes sp. N902-109]